MESTSDHTNRVSAHAPPIGENRTYPCRAGHGSLESAHLTLAVTVASALAVNVQLLVFSPLLEQAPDQTVSRVLLNLTDVPEANVAEPVLPTLTLMPDGVEVMRSPLRPVAVTVTVTFPVGGGGDAAAVNVSVEVREIPSYVAVIVTDVVVLTLVVATLKPHAEVPEPTVTLAGTLASVGLLLDRATVAPPVGAPPESDTNPDVGLPPVTLDGLMVTLSRVGPDTAPFVTVSGAERVIPLYDAVMVTVVLDATGNVVIANVPVNPVAVVVAGTLATDGLLLDSEITAPSTAAVVMITVPLLDSPPTTLVGLMSRFASSDGGGAACGVKLPRRRPSAGDTGRVDATDPPEVRRASEVGGGIDRRAHRLIPNEWCGEPAGVVDLDVVRHGTARLVPVERDRLRLRGAVARRDQDRSHGDRRWRRRRARAVKIELADEAVAPEDQGVAVPHPVECSDCHREVLRVRSRQ